MTEPSESNGRYRPISCDRYSELELYILQRRRVRLTWCLDNVIHTEVVQPLDLRTSQGEEYLVFRTGPSETQSVRLDRVRKAEPL
jgi:Rho-binding antiterminator